MHLVVLRPSSEGLAVEPEQDAERTPQSREGHVKHDRRNVSRGHNPGRDELGEAISPKVLVDSDRDEDRARDGLVRINGIGRRDTGDSSDLDTSAGVADDDDDAPIPAILIADGVDDVAENHDEHVGDHRHETHLGLSDAVVADRELHRDPIGEWTRSGEADEGADEESKVEKACE